MTWMESRGSAAFVVVWVFAALTAPILVRGNEPDRAKDVGTEVTELPEEKPWVGTGGTPALQAQRAAFHEQYVAQKHDYFAGKITIDLLLETERFLTQSDRECCAPREYAAASQLSLRRMRKIEALCKPRFAAGKMNQADMSQVEGQVRLVEFQAKQDQSK